MTNRKYIGSKVEELEALFSDSKSELSLLKALKNELLHRKTKRAKALMVEVKKALESFNSDVTGDPPTVSNPVLISISPTRDHDKNETGANVESGAVDIDWGQVFAAGNAARTGAASLAARSKPIENRPEDVLDTWTIIEALSPQTFKKPNDLVIGQGSVVQLNSGELPWMRGESSRPSCNLFYTIYLGSLDLGASTDDLLKIYQDQREEIPNVTGQAALAAVIVDKKGLPLGMDGLAISSYGWAYSRAQAGDS
jgi:ribosomal protein S7